VTVNAFGQARTATEPQRQVPQPTPTNGVCAGHQRPRRDAGAEWTERLSRIEKEYDTQGNAYCHKYDAATAGKIVNQVAAGRSRAGQ